MPRPRTSALQNWLFDRILLFLRDSDWRLVVTNFRKSKRKSERRHLGLTEFTKKKISLDKRYAKPRILIHELGHIFFRWVIFDESINLPQSEMRRMRSYHKTRKYQELRVLEWERAFSESLTKEQLKLLQKIIDDAPREKRR